MKLTHLIPTEKWKKLSKVILIITLSSFSILSYAQSQRVSLTGNSLSLKEVFKQIEEQTYLLVNYKIQDIDDSRVISQLPQAGTVEQVLDQLLEGTGCTVTFQDKYIIIQKQTASPSTQQSKSISGVVKDESGLPVIGANIIVKEDPTHGTITDIDGKFNLDVPQGVTLEVSYIGYESVTLAARNGMQVRPLPLRKSWVQEAKNEVLPKKRPTRKHRRCCLPALPVATCCMVS